MDVFAARPVLKTSARKADRQRAEKALKTFDAHLAPLSRLIPGPDGRCDASPAALVNLKREHREVVDAATTEAPLHPELTRPLLDAWSMTSLSRHEGRPEVAPWLRGWEEDEPQTSVVWRKHLPHVRSGSETTARAKMVTEFFGAAPIHVTERLEARSSTVMDWLLKRSTRFATRSTGPDWAADGTDIVAVVLNRAGEHVAMAKLHELQWLAAPAKTLSRREKAQRDGKKKEWTSRLLPGGDIGRGLQDLWPPGWYAGSKV